MLDWLIIIVNHQMHSDNHICDNPFRQSGHRMHAEQVLITHDMGVIAEAANHVAVLNAGRLVELGPVAEVLLHPRHPYAQGLIAAIPKVGAGLDMLPQIPGTMPRIDALPSGCAFHPRCDRVMPICRTERPEPTRRGEGVVCACWLEEMA